ncbi:MAG TPA: hypothetical protein ENN22_13015 [bacterium]|nr:hypothetical protein [bacterium]
MIWLIIANGKSSFIIAHRLSKVSVADEIVVLDKGRIVQLSGMVTQEELIRQAGFVPEADSG